MGCWYVLSMFEGMGGPVATLALVCLALVTLLEKALLPAIRHARHRRGGIDSAAEPSDIESGYRSPQGGAQIIAELHRHSDELLETVRSAVEEGRSGTRDVLASNQRNFEALMKCLMLLEQGERSRERVVEQMVMLIERTKLRD